MNKNLSLIFVISCLIMSSCNCGKEVLRPNRTTIIKVKATLSNTNFVIKQNDTLFIEGTFPDSVTVNRLNASDTMLKVNNLGDTYTSFSYALVDTSSPTPKASGINDFI